ncbi:MAG TPA: serine--tRNA ligase [Ktedonobacterales bacterium]
MLNERLIRDRPELVREALRARHAGPDAERALDMWLALDSQRRALARRHDGLAREAASLRGNAEVTTTRARVAETERRAADEALLVVTAQQRRLLMRLPNVPDERTPAGAREAENVELTRWGKPRAFDFAPKRHDTLAVALGLLDPPRAARIAGSRFPLLVGVGARLQRALVGLMLGMHTARGYVEIAPPHLLRREALEGSGHLPRFEDELYTLPRDDLSLSPTAEAQLVALHAGETLDERQLPVAYTAATPAFRREAGSAGSATRGLLRQHQFEKVELVRIATPETSDAAFDALRADAEAVLRRLELPYRVVALCAGELPFSARRTHDLEVWMPAMDRYVEISSISDCGPFQARRLDLRYRPAGGGRSRHAHTLNGSALAVGRTIAALLENGQRADGTVWLPEALHAAMGTAIIANRA